MNLWEDEVTLNDHIPVLVNYFGKMRHLAINVCCLYCTSWVPGDFLVTQTEKINNNFFQRSNLCISSMKL